MQHFLRLSKAIPLAATAAGAYYYTSRRTTMSPAATAPPPDGQLPIPPFETTFAVPMHCGGCVTTVESAVRGVPGVNSAAASLADQLVVTKGTAAPSAVLRALQAAGKDGILRGSGLPNTSAVAILETYDEEHRESPVRGLVRLVQVAPDVTVVDVSLSGVGGAGEQQKNEKWTASVRASGDVSRGPESLGAVYTGVDVGVVAEAPEAESERRGWIGGVGVESGKGGAVLVKGFSVWELIGRGMLVESARGERVAGVIARSAGVWDNDKTVCSCSGKTVWEEREEQRGRGML